jgi:hypothetical protein
MYDPQFHFPLINHTLPHRTAVTLTGRPIGFFPLPPLPLRKEVGSHRTVEDMSLNDASLKTQWVVPIGTDGRFWRTIPLNTITQFNC